jgi:DNA-binding XRE family transcriptional regulator
MTTQDFKIWMINNGYNQVSLAARLSISEQTISKYNNNGRYPVIFQLALKGLES